MLLRHLQVSMPRGREDLARRFYGGALGLREVDEPASLAGRGGCWFRATAGDGRTVTAEVHLGVNDPFVPAKKAHPAFLLGSVPEPEERAASIAAAGEVSWAERESLEGFVRFHCRDGFGDRQVTGRGGASTHDRHAGPPPGRGTRPGGPACAG